MSSQIFINFNTSSDINSRLLVELLKQFQQAIHACVGPFRSKFKFVAREGSVDDLVVTNSSKNLFSCLYKIDHLTNTHNEKTLSIQQLGLLKWQFDLIKSVMVNAHFNHFYDSGLLMCSFLNEFLILSKTVDDSRNSIDFNSGMLVILNELIQHLSQPSSDLIRLRLNLDNANNLKNLLNTSLASKCLIAQLDESKKDQLINLCLRAFVKSFNSDAETSRKYFSDIVFLFTENLDSYLNDSLLYDGVLFEIDTYTIEDYLESNINVGKLKTVLFDTTFSGDFEHLNNLEYQFDIVDADEFNTRFIQLNKFKDLFGLLIDTFEIDVVLCQKVVFFCLFVLFKFVINKSINTKYRYRSLK